MSVPSEILQDLTLQFIGTIIQGPQGPQGKDGPPGTNGTDGTNGTKGDKGDRGEPGLAGVNGINGINGTDGADGAPGKSAYQVAVSRGFSGTELQWLASLRGTDGKSFEVNSTGSLADRSNYDNRLPGFSFLDTDAGNLYIRQSSMPGVWSPPVPFGKGEKGDKGDKGEDGADGINGTNGINGVDGVDGTNGTNGTDGTNGTNGVDGADGMSAYELAVSQGYVGTLTDWLASLRGLDGLQGAKGDKGDKGDKGAKGDAGTGLTNRGLWVANTEYLPGDYVFAEGSTASTSMWILNTNTNYVSTLAPKNDLTNWVEFEAPAGAAGADGADGADGVNGVDGKSLELSKSATAIQWRQVGETWQNLVLLADITGPQGPQGIPGVNGTDGVDGADGINGTNGTNGTNGIDGKSVELTKTAAAINWRQEGGTWQELVTLAAITGPQGSQGIPSVTNFMSKGSQGAGTQTFDVSAASMQGMTVTGSITIALTGWPAAGVLGELCIELVNGGAFVITWPATVRWIRPDGTFTTDFLAAQQPLLASGTDFVFLWSRDGGSTIWGKVLR